MISKRQGK